MNIHHMHFFFDDLDQAYKLDPVAVHLEIYLKDVKEGEDPTIGAPFHLNIRCYGEAWTTFFSGPGQRTPAQFIRSCDVDYLANRLAKHIGMTKAGMAQDVKYIARIVEAVKDHIMTEGERQQNYCQKLIAEPGAEEVDYTTPETAPRFDKIVIVQFLNDATLYGPAPANNFNWHHQEGIPSIDKYWLMPGVRNDV